MHGQRQPFYLQAKAGVNGTCHTQNRALFNRTATEMTVESTRIQGWSWQKHHHKARAWVNGAEDKPLTFGHKCRRRGQAGYLDSFTIARQTIKRTETRPHNKKIEKLIENQRLRTGPPPLRGGRREKACETEHRSSEAHQGAVGRRWKDRKDATAGSIHRITAEEEKREFLILRG